MKNTCFYSQRLKPIVAILMIIWGICEPQSTMGQQRSEESVREVALKTVQLHSNSRKAKSQTAREVVLTPSSEIVGNASLSAGEEAFYICTIGDESQVIVSGDERMSEVLGFTDKPLQKFDDLPQGYRYLLEVYAHDYELMRDSNYTARKANFQATTTVVGPLLHTAWGQDTPYNNTCPMKNGIRCVTGCVATAMAQIMNYYRYPNNGSFDWDNMPVDYTSYTEKQAQAVAALMRSCGSNVHMQYGTGTSYAYDVDAYNAFMNVYGYPRTLAYMSASGASTWYWQQLLKEEIDKGHPIYFSGRDSGNNGHAFVIDGYRIDSYSGPIYFHINYGWDGSSDGYYQINNLRSYNYQQEAIINIRTESDALSRDGGFYQASSLSFSPRVMTNSGYSNILMHLGSAEFYRAAKVSNSEMRGYLVNTTTGSRHKFATWSLGEVDSYSVKNPVCYNTSLYASSLATGKYEVRFYSSSGGSDENLVTIIQNPVYVDVTSEKTALEYVDLGLPSHTLWANQNVGAKCAADCGQFFAWGETSTKRSAYLDSNNKYYSNGLWTKYCTSSTYGKVDNLSTLESTDDAATVVCGKEWMTPTYTQLEELRTKCTWKFTLQHDVYGYLVTGPNGNSIFLPFGGIVGDNSIQYETTQGQYWSSSLASNNGAARMISFTSSEIKTSSAGYRGWGRTIRPVYYKLKNPVTSITLSDTKLIMNAGEVVYLKATALPETAFDKTIEWSSSDANVASVNNNGQVVANSAGTVTITARAVDGSGRSATCQITVFEPATSIAMSHNHLRVTKGSTCRLLAAAMPTTASMRGVTFATSDTNIARVDEMGVITGVNCGTTNIIVTSVDNANITAQCKVTVLPMVGDVDTDGNVDQDDVASLRDCLLGKTADAAVNGDVDMDERTSIADMVALISVLNGGNAPFIQYPATNCQYYPMFKSNIEGQVNGYFYQTRKIEYVAGDTILFDWRISSEEGGDFATIFINGIELVSGSGELSGTFSRTFSSSGTLNICLLYSKDWSANVGDDCVSITNLRVAKNTPITETIPATLTFDDWASTNYHIDVSTSEKTYIIVHREGQMLSFDWTVDSEEDCDIFSAWIANVCYLSASGTSRSGHFTYTFPTSGTSELTLRYSKDVSDSEGYDRATVKNIRLTSE